MTDIYVATIDWTGSYGHTGISRFAFVASDASVPTTVQRDGVLAAVDALIQTNAGGLPADVAWQVNPIVEAFDGLTGAITGELPTATPLAPGVGTNTSSYANGVGLTITWKSAGMFQGRRVQGRTFIVPMAGQQFDQDGVLIRDVAGAWAAAANVYLAALGTLGLTPLIWGRPQDVKATPRKPAHHNPGHWVSISSATVSVRPAILGRRR